MNSSYLGAFIKIPTQYRTLNKTIKTCGVHEDYSEYDSTHLFCKICGSPMATKTIPTQIACGSIDLIDNSNFRSSHFEGVTYLSSNWSYCLTRIKDSYIPFAVDFDLIENIRKQFLEIHRKDLSILFHKIPNLVINIEFGIITSAS